MSIPRPTITTLIARIRADALSFLTNTDPWLRRSLLDVVLRVHTREGFLGRYAPDPITGHCGLPLELDASLPAPQTLMPLRGLARC